MAVEAVKTINSMAAKSDAVFLFFFFGSWEGAIGGFSFLYLYGRTSLGKSKPADAKGRGPIMAIDLEIALIL